MRKNTQTCKNGEHQAQTTNLTAGDTLSFIGATDYTKKYVEKLTKWKHNDDNQIGRNKEENNNCDTGLTPEVKEEIYEEILHRI